MRRGHLLESCVRPDFSFSQFDSKCWVSLNSFLFDVITLFFFFLLCSVSLQATAPSFLLPIHSSLCLNSCTGWILLTLLWAKSCLCPTLALSFWISLFEYWREFPSTISVCLSFCVSVCVCFFSAHCESSTVLSHASSFCLPLHPPLCYLLVLLQMVVRLCKLNSGNWAAVCHGTAALKQALVSN